MLSQQGYVELLVEVWNCPEGESASERIDASVHETGKPSSCFSFACSMRR
jgi:hypothetical protein